MKWVQRTTRMLLQILHRQLESLGIAGKAQMVSRFVEIYKQIWTLNGDHISMIYAGTGALGGGRSKVSAYTLSKLLHALDVNMKKEIWGFL